MLKTLAIVLLLNYPQTPNNQTTPGQLCTESDSDFGEYRYEEQIPYCERNVSSALKAKIYDDYRIPEADRSQYTIDHLIPLSLGGSNNISNLWPEAKILKQERRPHLEDELYMKLQAGEINQQTAIECILGAKFNFEECDLED